MAKLTPLVILVSFLLSSVPAEAITITLHDGTKIETEGVTLKPPELVTAEGKKLNMDDVKEITFQKAESIEAGKASLAGKEDEDVRALLALAKQMQEEYPKTTDAIVVRDWMEAWFDQDGKGSIVEHIEVATLVLNEQTRDENIRIAEATNNKTWRTRILKARSIDPDGTVHEFDRSTLVETRPKDDLNSMAARQDTVIWNGTIPGVKVGSIIHYKFERQIFNREEPDAYDQSWWFQGENPVADSYMILHVPREKKLNWVVRAVEREATNPTEKEEDEWRTYTWRMQNLDPFINEPDAPNETELRPAVFTTVYETWDCQSQFLGKMHKERLVVTKEIQAQVDELTQGFEDIEDKIAAIYNWIQEKVEYISIKGSRSSSQGGHPAAHTFGKSQGDCIDKAILFATMLKAIDVEAYPVVVRTNNEARAIMDRIPIVECNHAINEIHLKNPDGTIRIFYLDSTGSNYRYPFHSSGNHGVPAWNPMKNTVREVPVPAPADEMRHVTMDIDLKDNGDANVDEEIRYNGSLEMILRYYLRAFPKSVIKNWLEGNVNAENPGSKLIDFDGVNANELMKQFMLKMKISHPKYAQSTSGLLIFRLPLNYRSTLGGISLEERRLPVKFNTSAGKHDILRIKLPEGFAPRFLPEKFVVENPHLKYTATFKQEGDKLVFEDRFERWDVQIPPENYKEFRAACQKILKFIDTPLFFEKVEE
ncbi:MAG: DUF3857 domain-containing transglutaminase family protein [Planctomycetota bacterium]|jgi:transglutaminase-like putative cysteine protease